MAISGVVDEQYIALHDCLKIDGYIQGLTYTSIMSIAVMAVNGLQTTQPCLFIRRKVASAQE